ncbi:MAG TPA: hypothetical protein VGI32_14365 [Steroidobacteraceae bacterium]
MSIVSWGPRQTRIQLSAGFAKILSEQTDGSQQVDRVTRNFSFDRPETSAECDDRNAAATTTKDSDPNYAAALGDNLYDDMVIGGGKCSANV